MARRWMPIPFTPILLTLVALGPIPVVGWLGWRAVESLRQSVTTLEAQRLETEFVADLHDALTTALPGLRLAAGFAIADDDAIALAPEPAAAFLADARILRARHLLRHDAPIDALECLAPLLGRRPQTPAMIAATLLASDVLDDLDRKVRARELMHGIEAAHDLEPNVVRWLALRINPTSDAIAEWVDEIERRATSVQEIVLVRDLLQHVELAHASELAARVMARTRWPQWAARIAARVAVDQPAGAALVALDDAWFFVDAGRAQQVSGVAEWISHWRRDGARAWLAHASPGALRVGSVRGVPLTLSPGNPAIAIELVPPPRASDPRIILLAGLPLYAILAVAVLRALLTQRRKAIQLAEARGDLIAHVTHELRTPLTVLRMYAETLAQGRVTNGAREQYLATIGREAARLGQLVDRVAAEARNESADRPEREPIDAGALVSRVAQEFIELGTGSITVHVTGGLRVLASEEELRLVIEVLLDNAVRYAPSAIDVDVKRDGDAVVMRVRDHGPGIARDERERLFSRWYRGSTAKQSGKSGAGMGLYLARSNARNLGGEVTFEFPDDGGLCAVVRLPGVAS